MDFYPNFHEKCPYFQSFVIIFHIFIQWNCQLLQSDQTAGLFDQPISYRILLDQLYDDRMYGEVLECYAEIQKRVTANNQEMCKSVYAILAATYYRLVSCSRPFNIIEPMAYTVT